MVSTKQFKCALSTSLLVSLLPVMAADRTGAPVYNVRLATDSTPDLTNVLSYLRSITSQYETPQEEAVTIWSWSQRMRKQTSNPLESGQGVLDPILLFNNYGHCNCGIVSGLSNIFWLNMGWKAHDVQPGDHAVCETSWDDGNTWHMFDASMSLYWFNDDGQVASVDEIARNSRYFFEDFGSGVGTNHVKGPDDPQGWRNGTDRPVRYQRSLANGYDLFRRPNRISGAGLHLQWGHRYVIDLRPGDSYIRYCQRQDAGTPSEHYDRPLKNGTDVENQQGHQGIRSSGIWRYQPDLRASNAGDLVYASEGVVWGILEKGFAVRAADPSKPASVTFRVSAAKVATSAELFFETSCRSDEDSVAVEISATAGITCERAWKSEGIGINQTAEINLQSLGAGATEFLVGVNLSGAGAGLESLRLETITQINRASLSRLSRGSNRIQLTLGNQIETIQFRPSLVDGNYRATVEEAVSIDLENEIGFYKPILRPADNDTPASVTWKIENPTPITAVDYGATICVKSAKDRVSLLHSWDGKNFTSDFEKKDDAEPWVLVVNRLALGRSCTLCGAVNEKNPDSKNDLTDGIVARPSEDVTEKYMPTNATFEKDSVAVVTLDLEDSQEVAGLRINAGQERGFHLAFPETITVEISNGGTNFTRPGVAGHHQVFDPSADFIPWEIDDPPAYFGLPVGERLAFPYRVIFDQPQTARSLKVTCRAQEGWGQLLSEIQVFDTVEIEASEPPLVFLPKLKS